MIRILQCVNIMDRAGLENMLMNYYRNIDRTKIQFDFLTHRPDKGAYDEEIESLGGKVYHAPRLYPQNYPRYFGWMKAFFDKHPEYKIVHSHIDAMSFFPLLAAKKAGVSFRIAHSHSSKLDKDVKLPIKYVALKLIPNVSNIHFACGEMAGNFMFKKHDFTVIKNAIDISKFAFDDLERMDKRKKLGISDKYVIGHVGRYCYIKNQLFLLDIFERIKKIKPEAYLLLIGKGEDEPKIRKKISELGLDNSVLMLIDRSDVAQLYQAMDVFVMPSLFEGLPVVGVEAQANGLPCIFSNNVSNEILMTDNADSVELSDKIDVWVEKIINAKRNDCESVQKQLRTKGYDVSIESLKLKEIYESILSIDESY